MLSKPVKRTARWAWHRDETGRSATRQRGVYTTTLYGLAFFVILGLGFLFGRLGHQVLAQTVWFFGLASTAFIGTMEIGWEVLEYRSGKDGPDSSGEPRRQSERELKPGLTLSNDTKFGFFVTVLALAALIGMIHLSIRLATFL